jgi:hypothetical protein
VFGEIHLRRIVSMYANYYNEARTHLALGKGTPIGRPAPPWSHRLRAHGRRPASSLRANLIFGKDSRIADHLARLDLVILHERGDARKALGCGEIYPSRHPVWRV